MKAKQKSKHVLLVEDNLLNQKFAMAVLKMKGYTWDLAENGKIAVGLFEKQEYDAVLMDIQMPIMNGVEATIEIRKIEKKNGWPRIRIIAVTAFAMPGDEEKFKEIGIDLYISKPYTSDQLISFIEL
ncbi:MAG: histidine kinase [Bacteroidetes bacterium]|jgi:CheY-like chemotaxis protein|nr:histidine kinase [Bacteroidota bacterium]|tara:strand:+ start:211 stop:591 length:381 start_codon:yes stop_codon:yes gene_type:complete